MRTGVFLVTFQSSLATVGEAVVVCDAAGGVHGAGCTHAFHGRWSGDAEHMEVEVLHLSGEESSLLGGLPSLVLDLVVTRGDEAGFRAAGTVRGADEVHVKVLAKRVCDLVA